MANWYGKSRSNYFRVKDVSKFKTGMTQHDIEVDDGEDENLGKVAMFATTEDGEWPETLYHEDTDEEEEFDFIDVIKSHLADGEVCVLMTVGNEKYRYLTGVAFAFTNSADGAVMVSINDIYDKASEAFGITPTRAEY